MTKRSLIPAMALLTFMVANDAMAQVPKIITYQGVFADQAGTPVPDGNRTMTLNIYDAPTGGNILYTETQTVKLVRGVFNVAIGSVTPLPASLRFDRPYYLGVTVESNPEFSPRTQLTSSPFALHSATADAADSLSPNARGAINSINGYSGPLNIVGAGHTQVTQTGGTVTVSSNGVSSVNGVSGDVEIVGAGGATVTRSGNKFTITASANVGVQGVIPLDPSISVKNGNGNGAVAQVGVSEGGITTPKLADNAVTATKIADGAITDSKIAIGGIQYSKITGAPTSLPPTGPATGDLTGTYPSPTIALNAVTNGKLADNAVTTSKIVDSSVSSAKLGSGAVKTGNVADGSITDAKIANGISYSKLTGAPTTLPPSGPAAGDLFGTYPNPTIALGAVTTPKIADNAVTTPKIADASVTTPKVLDGAITTAKISDGSVTTAKISDASVTTFKIADASVTTAKLADGSVKTPKIADSSVTGVKIGTGAVETANIQTAAVTTPKIADASITDAKVAPGISYLKLNLTNSIVGSDITANAITTSKIANGSITTSKMADSAISGVKLLTNAVTTAHIADGAVTLPKISSTGAATNQAIIYNGTNLVWGSPTPAGAAGGDLTGTYPNPTIANNTITSAKIVDGTIVDADVSPTAAIAYSKLALTNSIQNGDLTANSVTTSKVANGTVTTSKLADSAVSGLKILTGAVTSTHIADGTIVDADVSPTAAIAYSKLALTNSIQNSDLTANSVTTSKVANGTVTTSKLADSAVSGLKLLTNAVTTAHIADGSVTLPKISSTGAATNQSIIYNGTSIVWGSPTPAGAAGGDLTGTYPNPTVANSAITSAKILDSTITNADVSPTAAIAYNKLALTNSIQNGDLTANSVTTSKVANGTVTTSKMADSAISGLKILTGAVTSVHIADGTIVDADVSPTAAIAYSKLALTNSIQNGDLTANSVTTSKVANGTVTTSKLADSAVSGLKLLTNAVTTAHIADGSVTLPKISSTGATANQSIIYNGTNIVWGSPTTAGAAGGDLTGTYPNPTIANNAITSAKIVDGTIVDADVSPTAAIAYSKLALTNSIQNGDLTANSVTTSKVANGTVTTSKMADSAISGLKLLTGAVNTAHIADGAVTDAKVANGISYSKLSGAPASLPPSGAAGGDLTGTYPNPTVANSAITSAKILDGTITNADVSTTAAIAYSKLNLANSIATADIANSAVTPAKISSTGANTNDVLTYNGTNVVWASGGASGAAGGDLSGTYPNPTVANDAITSAKILDGTIANADISPTAAIAYSKLALTNSIQNGDITANAITTSKVANGTVTTSKMADSAISGLKLLTFAVTNRHIADNAVTLPKIDPTGATTGQVISYNGTNVVWGSPTTTGAAGGDLTGTYPNPTVANDAITSAKILDGTIANADVSPTAAIAYSKLALTNSIQNGDITANAITTSKVANGTVTTSKLADSAVSGLKLLTFAVTNRHLADNAVTLPKIDPTGATTGQVISYNGTSVTWATPSSAAVTTNATLTGNGTAGSPLGINLGNSNTWTANQTFGGTFLITANSRIAMTNSDNNARDIRFQEPSGTGSQYIGLRAPSVTNNGNYVFPAVVGSVGQVMTLSTSNGIDSATMAWSAITADKISGAGANTNDVLTYNGSTVVWAAAAGGGATGAAGGDLSGTYPNPTVANDAITSAKILDGTITNADIIAAAGIPYSKLTLTNSVGNSDLTANSVTTSKVANGTVTTSKMADSAISGLKLLTFAVTNRHLASSAVTSDKISGAGAANGQVLTYNSGTNTVGWANPSVGFAFNRVAISNINSPYTIPAGTDLVGVDVTAGPVTVTLPPANSVASGKIIIVKNELGNAATNNITIQRNGTDLINAASTQVTISAGTATGSFNFYSDGVSRWQQY